ncbi:MAG: Hsp20/alpha crystallin family protein [Cyclobacteriaceae bacterium]|nr:Hsp20/alpha crystallin family protein [Cyclobacteriaceae bacterium]
MSLLVKNNGGFPTLFSDWLNPALLTSDFMDFDSEAPFQALRLGINVPSANVAETPKEYMIDLAAPGLERKDFKVEINNHTLTVSSEKKEEQKEEKNGYSRKEFSYSSFSRSFSLPENVKEGSIDAKYQDGILKITIPKKEVTVSKPVREIAVS